MAFSDWSTVDADNGTAAGVSIVEGCPAANMNNWGRRIMSHLRSAIAPVWDVILACTTAAQIRTALGVPEGSVSLTAFGGLTNAANKLPYMTGSDAWDVTTLSAFMRTVLDDGDAATALATLGAIGLTSATFGTNTMDVRLKLSSTVTLVMVAGSGTLGANTTGTVNFGVTFGAAPFAMVNGGGSNPSNEGDIRNTSAASTTGIAIANSSGQTDTYTWIAIGKL